MGEKPVHAVCVPFFKAAIAVLVSGFATILTCSESGLVSAELTPMANGPTSKAM